LLLANRLGRPVFVVSFGVEAVGRQGVFIMKALEEKILREGKILPGNVLKVSHFLNHQLDVDFLMEMGREIARLFEGAGVNKILTIEASGIALAVAAAAHMHVPVLFAKKSASSNMSADKYTTEVASYTHKRVYHVVVSRDLLSADDRVLIIDDFLACGNAMIGLMDLVRQAGGEVVGVSAAIEKGYQGGGDKLRAENIRVESLAIIDEMTENGIRFR
jgi:xanthine phosphoribosyltransferase